MATQFEIDLSIFIQQKTSSKTNQFVFIPTTSARDFRNLRAHDDDEEEEEEEEEEE
jgi:hypothetical protein